MASCSHKLHENIIDETQLYLHKQDRTFMIVNETALVIDRTNYIEKCPHCNMSFKIYVYGDWPNLRASFDGVTDLPICVTVDNIAKFITYISVFSEPRLGKKFIRGINYDRFEKTNSYFIMDWFRLCY